MTGKGKRIGKPQRIPIGPRRIENPRSNPVGLHQGSRLSQHFATDFGFRGFPGFESSFACRDPLPAFIENALVPCRRLDRFRRTRQILPKRFHDGQLLASGHIFQLQDRCHNHSIVYRRSIFQACRASWRTASVIAGGHRARVGALRRSVQCPRRRRGPTLQTDATAFSEQKEGSENSYGATIWLLLDRST